MANTGGSYRREKSGRKARLVSRTHDPRQPVPGQAAEAAPEPAPEPEPQPEPEATASENPKEE
jgi:hypothetical protein